MPPKFYHDGRETALHAHITSLAQSQPSLQNNPSAILSALDDYVATHSRMMIFQQPKVDAAQRVLEKLDPKPRILVELGGYVGKSAIAWGAMLRDFHADGQVQVFSMELEPDFVRIIRDFVEIAGLTDIVEVVEGQSGDSLRNLKQQKGIEKIDALFLDHWEKFYLSDLKVCEELGLLRVGSVVVADNTDMPGAPEYLRYVEGGGEGAWKYRCEKVLVDEPQGSPRAVHFAFVEGTPYGGVDGYSVW